MRVDMSRVAAVIPSHPARNRSSFLSRAVTSVAAQTRQVGHVSIAVDLDRSGAPATRQRALEQADPSCGWVAFLDSDDVWKQNHVETLHDWAMAYDLDYVYSWFQVITPGGRIIDDPVFPATHRTDPFDPENPIETTITVLVRQDLAREVGFQALEGRTANTGEDRGFTLGCLAAGARIGHVPDVTTWLWSHEGQNTSGLATKGDAANG